MAETAENRGDKDMASTDADTISTPYTELDKLLRRKGSDKPMDSRKVANNTYAERRGEAIAIRLHNTDVVTMHKDGRIVLNTGGWFTVTTKDRINRYLPHPWRLCSVRGRWFLERYNPYPQDNERVAPYVDGMTLTTGGLVGQPVDTTAEDKANDQTSKAIDRYVIDGGEGSGVA